MVLSSLITTQNACLVSSISPWRRWTGSSLGPAQVQATAFSKGVYASWNLSRTKSSVASRRRLGASPLRHICSDAVFQSVKCTFETEEGKGVMNVWVEPTVWESSKERPIKQLEVKVTSYLDNHPVKGSAAVADVDSPCQSFRPYPTG